MLCKEIQEKEETKHRYRVKTPREMKVYPFRYLLSSLATTV